MFFCYIEQFFFYNMGAKVDKTVLLVSRNYLLPSFGCLSETRIYYGQISCHSSEGIKSLLVK
jgi:hypothetical protein